MRFTEVLTRILHWRWLPFVLPVSYTLAFVGSVVLAVPESVDGTGASDKEGKTDEESSEKGRNTISQSSSDDESSKLDGSSRSSVKSRLSGANRLGKTITSHTPHNPRITPPRTGPRPALGGSMMGHSTTLPPVPRMDEGAVSGPQAGPPSGVLPLPPNIPESAPEPPADAPVDPMNDE